MTPLPLRRPLPFTLLALSLAALAALALLRASPEVDLQRVVDTPAARTALHATHRFDLHHRLAILLQAPTPHSEPTLLDAAHQLRDHLPDCTVTWTRPFDPDAWAAQWVAPLALLYADPATLPHALSPDGLDATLRLQVARLGLPGTGQRDRWIARDPLDLAPPLIQRLRTLDGGYHLRPTSPELFDPTGQYLLLDLRSQLPAATLARRVQHALAQLPVTAHAAGGPLVEAENASVVRDDLVLGLGVSVTLAFLLMAWGLRLPLRWAGVLFLPTLWGAWVGAGAFATLRPGFAALALSTAGVLIGLGVDFTLHLIAAAQAERAHGHPPRLAVAHALRTVRGALLLAAATSSAAFLAFLLADAGFLHDMGCLVVCGLLACLFGDLYLLPPLLARSVHHPQTHAPRDLGATQCVRWIQRHPSVGLGFGVALTAGAVAWLVVHPLELERDLRRVQVRHSPAADAEAAIVDAIGGTRDPLLLWLAAPDDAQLLAACHALEPTFARLIERGGLVARSSPAALLPPLDRQRANLDVLQHHPDLVEDVRAAMGRVGFDPDAFPDYFAGLEEATNRRAPADLETLRAIDPELVARFVRHTEDGVVALLRADPARTLWSEDARAKLLRELSVGVEAARAEGATVQITGPAVVSAEVAEQVAGDFARVSGWTVLAVLGVVCLAVRSVRGAVWVILPAALGTVWTAAAMSGLGVRLNLMNLGVIPMVLALGIDDGVHLTHRHRGGSPSGSALRATLSGVVWTSLTTIVTFGSLTLSRNRGIASVGAVTMLGVGACLVASLVVWPAVWSLSSGRRGGSS